MNEHYEIIYMKADFEPWWQFDGWEEYIVERWQFDCKKAFDNALQNKLTEMRQKFPNERFNKQYFYAFWDENELEYCEGCDEDAQVYHGIITYFPATVPQK